MRVRETRRTQATVKRHGFMLVSASSFTLRVYGLYEIRLPHSGHLSRLSRRSYPHDTHMPRRRRRRLKNKRTPRYAGRTDAMVTGTKYEIEWEMTQGAAASGEPPALWKKWASHPGE